MVNKQFGIGKWQNYNTSSSQSDSTDRRIKEGMGSILQENINGGQWTNQESVKHITILELKAVHLGLLTFT